MKTRLLFFLTLFSICIRCSAQLNEGYAVVTNSGAFSHDEVVKVFDISAQHTSTTMTLGSNWSWFSPTSGEDPTRITSNNITDWKAEALGQVFGLAINTNASDHFIYVASTQIYTPAGSIVYSPASKYQHYSPSAIPHDGAVLIWQLNPTNGVATALVTASLVDSEPDGIATTIFNRGTGIGNICFDRDHNQIFATNMEDGRIYRIRASSGEVLSRYDPNKPYVDDLAGDITHGSFVKLQERHWGIAYHNDRLYFSRWNDNYHASNLDPLYTNKHNEIYAVNIRHIGGEFNISYPHPTPETFIDDPLNPEQPIIAIPFIINTSGGTHLYSSPVSDIEVSANGRSLLLGERTMSDAYYHVIDSPVSPYPVLNWAHKSRVLRYDYGSCEEWEFAQLYQVGNANQTNYQRANCAGGVDFDLNKEVNQQSRVWSTGDALVYQNANACVSGTQYVYGIAGMPLAGNTVSTVCPTSIYMHIFGDGQAITNIIDLGTADLKTDPGDMDIFRFTPCFFDGELTENIGSLCECNSSVKVEDSDLQGSAPYTYTWSNGSTSQEIHDLCAGSGYTVTVTDEEGCMYIDNFCIPENPLGTFDLVQSGCTSESNAGIDISGLNDSEEYTYSWSSGETTPSLDGLAAGTYSVTITDANGCTGSATIILSAFNAVASSVLAPICYGTNTGSSIVTVEGGTAPYTYLWSNGEIVSAVTNLPAGPFSVTVTDANGCTDISTGGVVSAPELVVGIQAVSPVTCYGSCNGQATAVVTGGTPGYTYNWYNSASTSSTATDLCAGSFEVTVTDAQGCTASAQVGIETAPAMDVTLSVSHVSCYGQNDGSITANVTGGTQPYTYVWSGGMTSQMIDGLHPTMYTLTVTDANGCSATAMAIINDAPVFEGELIMPDTLCVGSKDTVRATGTGYGRFIFEDGHTDIFSLSDGFIMEITASPGDVGTHLVCLVVYSAEPAEGVTVCTDTICREAVIIGCGCDSIAGNADLWSNSMGNMKYEFYNAGSIEASFINWYVDGQMMAQTTGHGGFSHQFTQGIHEICMEAAYILPGINGHNICCYDRVCDSIKIDLCEAWKAESRISTSADINNYHNVTFHFGGNMSPVPTIIWNFGDNTTEVSSGTDPVTHYYPASGTYDVCAYVVWSNGEWTPEDMAVCCCVDTICFTVEVTPCNDDAYRLWVEGLNATTPTVVLEPMPSMGADIVWYLDGSSVPLQTGDSRYYTFAQGITGYHEVCAEISYILPSDFPGESDFSCNLRICNRFSFGDMPKPYGMLRYFPNPTRNMITVEYMAGLNEVVSIAIMDPLGKVMKVKEATSQTEGLDQAYITLEGLASGLYLMRVAVAKEVQTVKILKE